MSKHRRAAKVDDNQREIVAALRRIPGVTVEVGHDDILVGRNGRTYWFELKRPEEAVTGRVRPSSLKKSQVDLLASWRGHYSIVWTLGQILEEIGVTDDR